MADETSDPEISFSGLLTEADFRRIHLAGYPRIFRFWPWLYLSAIVVAFLAADLKEYAAHLSENLPGALLLLLLALFLYIAPRRAARKVWQTTPGLREPFSGSLSSVGVEWKGTYGQGRYPWNDLFGYRDRGEILLVYFDLHTALFLLPRFFAGRDEWEAAREMVLEHLRPR